MADALSRAIFPDSECDAPPLQEFGELIDEKGVDPIKV